MRTAQFILAVAFGWFLADHLGHSWPWIAFLTISVSAVITLLTLVVQHWSLPPAARSRRGLTVLQGQLTWLFLGTDGHESRHRCRRRAHSAAAPLREDRQIIHEALGHASIMTTTMYAHMATPKRLAELSRFLE